MAEFSGGAAGRDSEQFQDLTRRDLLKAGAVISAAVAASTLAVPAFAQALRPVPRERTVIFDIDGGRVAAPDLWNPFVPGARRDHGFHQCMIEPLFILNYETGQIEPWLCKGYEVNEDLTEWVFFVREGVKWADGMPFTGQDIVFTINMLKNNPRLGGSADMNKWVADVQSGDPGTVWFKLTEPNPRFVLDFFAVKIWGSIPIVPKHIWENVDPVTFKNYDPARGWPVFTGPYRVVKISESEFVYDRRDDWWAAQTGFQPLPVPERLVWTWLGPEETRAAAMAAGKLDSLMDITRGTYEVLKARNPRVQAWYSDLPYAWLDPCPRYLGLNNQIEPWNDREIRWAINWAIDRDELIAISYEGTSIKTPHLYPMYPPINALMEEIKDLFVQYPVLEYNPDRTREIFERKGFRKGRDGIYVMPDGRRLEMSIATPAAWIEKKKNALMVIEQLQRVGVDATMRVLEVATWSELMWTGQAEAFVHWSCGSINEPWATLDRYHSRWILPRGERQFNNDARMSNPEYDALVDQIGVLPLGDPRIKPLFRRAMEIWLQELPVIPLAQAKKLIPFDFTYWTGWPTSRNNYIHPPTWWQHTIKIILNLKPAR
jgi:peptide/nickel transport system substrate-binding protein